MRRKKIPTSVEFFPPSPITAPLSNLGSIELHQVRRTPEEKLFNILIRQYHYVGYSQPVGEQLKYLAYASNRLIACFAFSWAPYAIDCRDDLLKNLPSPQLLVNGYLLSIFSLALLR